MTAGPGPGGSLRGVGLEATSVADAVRFYADVLGASVALQDGDRYAVVEAGGIRISLLAVEPADRPAPPALMIKVARGAGEDALMVVWRESRRIVAGGGYLIEEPAQGPHEVRAVLADPSGNRLLVYAPLG